jgi:hypothetical protein
MAMASAATFALVRYCIDRDLSELRWMSDGIVAPRPGLLR